jgi:hypothetical protein
MSQTHGYICMGNTWQKPNKITIIILINGVKYWEHFGAIRRMYVVEYFSFFKLKSEIIRWILGTTKVLHDQISNFYYCPENLGLSKYHSY